MLLTLKGSFSNDDGDGRFDALKKFNLYSAFEFRNSVNLFRTPICLKICSDQTCTDSDHFQKKIPKISHCGSRSPKYIELNHFTLLFAEDGKEMYKDSKRTWTAIVLLIKPFVWRRSRRRRRRGLLKLPFVFWAKSYTNFFKRLLSVHGGYTEWSPWSQCSKSCDGGKQDRSRSCTNPQPANEGKDCSLLGRDNDSRTCNTYRCPGNDFYYLERNCY